jgi:AbrB family looped-hinge helix DNA binding protein
MNTPSVKVSQRYQIAVPQTARRKLNIKKGDRLLVDVQDGMLILAPQPKTHTDRLAGLHKEIWASFNAEEYVDGERKAWMNSSNG